MTTTSISHQSINQNKFMIIRHDNSFANQRHAVVMVMRYAPAKRR